MKVVILAGRFGAWKRVRSLLNTCVARNALALYAVQFAGYVLPIITLPYLARVLRPSTWGLVAFSQAFSWWIVLLLEYGFNFSATREVARNASNKERVGEIVASVVSAKVLLCGLVALVAVLVAPHVSAFKAHPNFLFWAVLSSILRAFSPLWLFQGTEQMPRRAWIDIATGVFYVVLVVCLVRSPSQGWLVLALQAATNLLGSGLLLVSVYRQVKWLKPSLPYAVGALKMGASMFLFCCAVSLYTTANTVVLGLFVNSTLVSFYAGPERILKAAQGLLGPMAQAVYPRIDRLRAEHSQSADVMLRYTLVIMLSAGLAVGVLTFLLAPLAVRLLLGPQYLPAIPVLRILAGVIPVVALSIVFGMQCMLPLGMDREFNVIIVGCGILNIVMALILAPQYGPVGMASAVLISEILVTTSQFIVLRAKRVPHFRAKGYA